MFCNANGIFQQKFNGFSHYIRYYPSLTYYQAKMEGFANRSLFHPHAPSKKFPLKTQEKKMILLVCYSFNCCLYLWKLTTCVHWAPANLYAKNIEKLELLNSKLVLVPPHLYLWPFLTSQITQIFANAFHVIVHSIGQNSPSGCYTATNELVFEVSAYCPSEMFKFDTWLRNDKTKQNQTNQFSFET